MRTKANQKRNGYIICLLREMKFTPKERIYATLILDVLEAANNLDMKLHNCVIEHNLIEQILFDSSLSFISDEFGRRKTEMGEDFINACKKLNQEFIKNNPEGSTYSSQKGGYVYFTKEFSRERNFMQKLILKFVNILELTRVNQRYFVSVSHWNESEKMVWFRWTIGTQNGDNVLNDNCTTTRLATDRELKKAQKEINKYLENNSINDMDKIMSDIYEIIENTLPLSKLNNVA